MEEFEAKRDELMETEKELQKLIDEKKTNENDEENRFCKKLLRQLQSILSCPTLQRMV